jgi:membrane-bound lytic murein transglycosylase D
MTGLLRYIIVVFLLFTAVVSHAAHNPAEKRTASINKKIPWERKLKKKALLSTLLMFKLNSSHTVTDTEHYLATDGYTSYGLPFLKTPKMKKSAVESVYRKFGFNSNVELKIKNFSRYKKSFQKRLYRSGKYVRTMTDIFEEENLPQELIFLPLIESQFNPYAYSRTRASGPWQFMPATARKLQLKINWWVDERRDPIKSTKAAARYLKYLYKRFGSWPLALAAYNGGEGRIKRAVRKTGSNDFWKIRTTGYIARETKDYVPSYIAASAIAMNPEDFGFGTINYQKPLMFDEVVIHYPMDLALVAKFSGVEVDDIRNLNPELRRLCTPPNVTDYTLRIPKGRKSTFLAKLDKTGGDDPFYVSFYTVKRGDTVQKIAMKLGAPVKAIIDMNKLGKKALIRAGKNILIPFKRNLNAIMPNTGI